MMDESAWGTLPKGFIRFTKAQNLERNEPNRFTVFDMLSVLQCLLTGEEDTFSEEEYKVLTAMFLALAEVHPEMRLKLEMREQGEQFRVVVRIENAEKARIITNAIDTAVARGEKQEAFIEEAMTKFKISRREVFRIIRAVRQERAAMLEMGIHDSEVPSGFQISVSGRLVPKD